MTVVCVTAKIAPNQASSSSTVPSPGPPSWIEDAIPSRVQNHVLDKHDEVLPDEAIQEAHIPRDNLGNVEKVLSMRRFSGTTKSDATALYMDNVVPNAEWAVVIPHICDSDEPAAERTGCSHDTNAMKIVGSPPSEVMP